MHHPLCTVHHYAAFLLRLLLYRIWANAANCSAPKIVINHSHSPPTLTARTPCHSNSMQMPGTLLTRGVASGKVRSQKDAPAKVPRMFDWWWQLPILRLLPKLRAGVAEADVLRQYAEAALIFSYFSGSLRADTPTEKAVHQKNKLGAKRMLAKMLQLYCSFKWQQSALYYSIYVHVELLLSILFW